MKKIVSIGIVSLLVIGGFLGIMDFTSGYANGYTTHSPIYIDGNANFTAENGVSSGTGTQSDPYIIENWDINASSANGIDIRNTTAYFIIRNCYAHDGGESYDGIYLNNVWNGRVKKTNSSNNRIGIILVDSSNNIVTNNNANSNKYYGIILYYSSRNNIFNNTASNNWFGIHLSSSSFNSIHNNSVNSNNGWGIALRDWSCSNILSKNSASNNDEGIFLDYSINNNISNNNVNSNNYEGITLYYSSYNNILNNSANSNSWNGIYLYYSDNNNISNNSASSNNDDGIRLWSSSNNGIYNNSVNSNNWVGIYLGSSNNNNIYDNSVNSNNYEGIFLYSSSYNSIFINNVSNNDYGIRLNKSSENEITDCNISNNNDGIYLSHSSNDNWVYHNNFIDNTNQAYDECTNYWDDGSKGNYWSDYTGKDANHDGIGDTPYDITGDSNQDRYPLMTPWDVPPTIISVTPQNLATNILITTNIVVIFSEPMDQIATQNAFTLETGGDPVSGTFSWNLDSDTMTFEPAKNLLGETTYWVNITTEATDLVGESLSLPWSSPFRTEKDTTSPAITDIIAIPHPQEVYDCVNISANVMDNVAIDTVWINIANPNGVTVGNFTMIHDPVNDRYYKNQTYDIIGTYQFIIWANDTSDNWNSSSGLFTMQDTTPPTTPVELIVTDIPNDEGGALNITWDANTELDLDHYTLYSNKTGSWTVANEISAGTEYYIDTGLTDGTRYYYNISASDDASNESPQSATVSGVPADDLPPATPTAIAVTSLRNGDLNITWNLNTDDTQTYSIYSNKTGTWILLVNITHPQNSYVDTGLTSGTTYYYKISAWDEVPLECAIVTIYESDTPTDHVNSTTTNSNGEYSIDVPPGTYDVKVEKSGYDTQWEKDVEVTADQTTTTDLTLPTKADILSDYWWLIPLIVIIIIIIIIATLIAKKKKPIEEDEDVEREEEKITEEVEEKENS
jgi:parallel beta-helix repeat protein